MAGHNNIEYAGLSDIGMRRGSNQDSFAMLPAADAEQYRVRGHVFLVADGMGAHAVGELASKLAADNIPLIYTKHAHEGATHAIRRAFLEANTAIHTKGQQNQDFEGMGTTTSALLLRPEGAWISHVGDSRVYRIRRGKMEQLSFDHSLVWEMARRQKCKPEELAGIPQNVIVRSLGPEPLVQIDIEGPHEVEAGDVYLLCSDGLCGPLSDSEIGAVASVLPPEEACQTLIDLANLHGGPDNITCIIVRVGDDIQSESEADDEEVDVVSGRKKTWHEKLPWALLSLGVGIILAFAAIVLTVNRLPGGSVAFGLAAIGLIVGIVGIFLQSKSETHDTKDHTTDISPPHVYRETPCTIKSELFTKLAEARQTVEEKLKTKDLQADWDMYKKHLQETEALQQKKELKEAFRESCMALRVLTEVAHTPKNRK